MAQDAIRIRPFKPTDQVAVKYIRREWIIDVILSDVKGYMKQIAGTFLFKVTAAVVAAVSLAVSGSVLYCLASICATHLLHCVLVYLNYSYGAPSSDMNRITEIYQSADDTQFWIAEAGRASTSKTPPLIVGTVGIIRNEPETGGGEKIARLQRMAVRKSHRRMGIGQRLVDTSTEFCRQQGYVSIKLTTSELNPAARQLYAKNGFLCLRVSSKLGQIQTEEYERRL